MRRVLRGLSFALFAAVVFVAALGAGILVHLRLGVVREALVRQVDRALADSFAGRVRIERIESLGLHGVSASQIDVDDPDGVRVLTARGVRVSLSAVALARAAIAGDEIVIDRVEIDDANVLVDDTSRGLRLARAFAPRHPSPSHEPSKVVLSFDDVEIAHAWVHGVAGGLWIDGDVAHAGGSLEIVRDRIGVELRGAEVVTRAMPRDANPRGHVRGRVLVADATHAFAAFTGRVGEVPVRAEGRVDGGAFLARASVPDTPPEAVRSIAPEVPLFQDVSAEASAEGRASSFVFRAHARAGAGEANAHGRVDHGDVVARASGRHLDLRAVSPSLGKSDIAADVALDLRGGVLRARGRIDPGGGHAAFTAVVDEHAATADASGNVWNARTVLAPFVRGVPIDGRGAFHAHARIDRDARLIAATASARFEEVSAGSASAAVVELDGRAEGPLRDPSLSLELYAERTVVPHASVSSARVHVRGHARDAEVGARVAANGPFDLSARVKTTEAGAVAVEDLDVRSSGRHILSGSLDWDHGRGHARLVGRDIDLARVRQTLGVDVPLDGRVALDVDASVLGDGVEGHAMVDAREVVWDTYRGIDARVEASSLRGGALSFVGRARVRDLGWLSLEAVDLHLPGPALEEASWRRVTGSVHVDTSASLAEIARLAARTKTPVMGWGRVSVVARRDKPDEAPDVVASVSTYELSVTRKAYAVDLAGRAHVGSDGALDVHVGVGHGASELRFDARSNVDWKDVLAGKVPDLETLPFTADVALPSQDVTPLCREFGVLCRGRVTLGAHVDGPVRAGRATIAGSLVDFRSPLSPFDGAIDAALTVDLGRSAGTATLSVSPAGNARKALEARLDAHVPGDLSSWYGSLDARFADLGLRAPPFYSDERVAATLGGTVTVADLHRDARVRVALDATNIRIAGMRQDHATITGGFDGATLSLATHLDGADANLDLRARAAATWGRALSPKLDTRAPADLAVRANGFRLRTLAPIVPAALGDVDGRLDADAAATIGFAPARVAFKGWAKLSNATIESAMLGDLRDLQGKLTSLPDGSFVLEDAHVRGTTGFAKLTGRAHATAGLVDEVKIGATIDEDDKFPLVVSGQAMGNAWGRIETTVRLRRDRIGVDVDVPSLHVTLPEQARRALQELGASKSVTVGVRSRGELVPVALAPPRRPKHDPLPVTISVKLGSDVDVARGDMLKIALTGNPVVHIAETTTVTGQIRLLRGTLDVEGKKFDIERGTVTFSGDPSNPTLNVAAGWKAPDGSQVTALYLGPVKEGRLVLSSDPPHTQDEIVALLVFGSAEGPTPSTGASGTNLAAKAISTGASFATQPLNQALERLTHIDIKTRIDTSGVTTRSEVEVQIARTITAQVAYVLGVPPPGQDPDQTWLTLAWNATARWSFDFTIGDQGSTIVEALWHKRY